MSTRTEVAAALDAAEAVLRRRQREYFSTPSVMSGRTPRSQWLNAARHAALCGLLRNAWEGVSDILRADHVLTARDSSLMSEAAATATSYHDMQRQEWRALAVRLAPQVVQQDEIESSILAERG